MSLGTLKKRLGDILVDVGIITHEQLNEALETQKTTGEKLGTILAQMGVINEEIMLAFLGKQCGVAYISLNEYGNIPKDVIHSVPESVARYQSLIPIAKENNTITIAMADPFNVFAVDDIKVMTGYDTQVVIASESEIKAAIEKYYSHISLSSSNPFLKAEELKHEVINSILSEAVKSNASDIHIEPQAEELRVRFRIDGMLQEQPPLPKKFHDIILVKLRAMANLDEVKNLYLPQESRIKIKIFEKNIDLRISIIPTILGQRITLQIMNPEVLCKDLAKLGFETETQAIYKKHIEASSGLIILTGPIHSGTTTTLYSTLSHLYHPDRNILTIEDPVEYILPGITQVQISNRIGLTSSSVLQAFQRQNPDLIMVGKIHDQETATLAIDSALTGHLVFISLPMNNTVSAISHLINMGVEPFMIASATLMVVSQNLMRIICPNCKESYKISNKNLRNIGIDPKFIKDKETLSLWRGKGCKKCKRTGYQGRTAIYEILELDEKLRSLVREQTPELMLKKAAVNKGLITLREAAWRKVQSGVSTAEEMLRITKSSK